jgi:hypothetical protein
LDVAGEKEAFAIPEPEEHPMADRKTKGRRQDEEPEEEMEALEEGDEEALEEELEGQVDGDIRLSINEDVVEIVIPRNGEEEKTLTALGQAVQSLGS